MQHLHEIIERGIKKRILSAEVNVSDYREIRSNTNPQIPIKKQYGKHKRDTQAPKQDFLNYYREEGALILHHLNCLLILKLESYLETCIALSTSLLKFN